MEIIVRNINIKNINYSNHEKIKNDDKMIVSEFEREFLMELRRYGVVVREENIDNISLFNEDTIKILLNSKSLNNSFDSDSLKSYKSELTLNTIQSIMTIDKNLNNDTKFTNLTDLKEFKEIDFNQKDNYAQLLEAFIIDLKQSLINENFYDIKYFNEKLIIRLKSLNNSLYNQNLRYFIEAIITIQNCISDKFTYFKDCFNQYTNSIDKDLAKLIKKLDQVEKENFLLSKTSDYLKAKCSLSDEINHWNYLKVKQIFSNYENVIATINEYFLKISDINVRNKDNKLLPIVDCKSLIFTDTEENILKLMESNVNESFKVESIYLNGEKGMNKFLYQDYNNEGIRNSKIFKALESKINFKYCDSRFVRQNFDILLKQLLIFNENHKNCFHCGSSDTQPLQKEIKCPHVFCSDCNSKYQYYKDSFSLFILSKLGNDYNGVKFSIVQLKKENCIFCFIKEIITKVEGVGMFSSFLDGGLKKSSMKFDV